MQHTELCRINIEARRFLPLYLSYYIFFTLQLILPDVVILYLKLL